MWQGQKHAQWLTHVELSVTFGFPPGMVLVLALERPSHHVAKASNPKPRSDFFQDLLSNSPVHFCRDCPELFSWKLMAAPEDLEVWFKSWLFYRLPLFFSDSASSYMSHGLMPYRDIIVSVLGKMAGVLWGTDIPASVQHSSRWVSCGEEQRELVPT